MNASPVPAVQKRKRMLADNPLKPAAPQHDAPRKSNLRSFDEKLHALEKKAADLLAQKEAYHLLVQKHYSEKIRLRNRVSGVMKHIKETLANDTIPGGKVKQLQQHDPEALFQENRLLKWKLSVIEHFFANSFPELEPLEEEDLSCSGTPLKEGKDL
ncbi:MAG: hypothetical protein ACO1NW_01150 [Chitinophagaceae bacterium]